MLRLIQLEVIDCEPASREPASSNNLLNDLPREDALAIAGQAERVLLRAGDHATLPDGSAALWLPETAIFSFGETLAERNVECGIVGSEGAIGWEPMIGLAQTSQRLVTLIGGSALAIRGDMLEQLCERRPALVAHLLRFRETLMIQMRWTIAARLQNGPDRRLARWLCMLHDRVDGDTLDITHLRLAAFLNARRASITDSLHVLEGERVVRCTRGKVFVRSRAALEAAAGAAYGPAERAYASLFGGFGKMTNP